MSDDAPAVTGQLMFGVFMGAIAMAAVEMAMVDWKARAEEMEEARCKDEPDRAAWMGRRPGEAHSVEACIKVPRYGDPAWVPYFQHPLGPPKERK